MRKSKQRRILTTSNLKSKKVPSEEPEVEETERGEISFEPHQGQSATQSGPSEEVNPSISGTSPRSLPSPWGKPLVVFIPAWNCKKWIQDAFISLAEQTLSEDEWGAIVFDDASDDGMERICRRWGVDHLRVDINRGKAAQINLACKLFPKETIFIGLDADDSLFPEAIESIRDAWEETPEATLIYSQYVSCSDDLSIKCKGHCRQAGFSLDEAGYISHLKTYRAGAIKEIGYLDENVRKSVDKELVYYLQELSEKTGRPIKFIDKVLYYYRRRKEGSITMTRHYDATLARRNAYKRRNALPADTICIFSASEANDTGGPGIFWGRLLHELEGQEKITIVSSIRDSDLILGNTRIANSVDHQRPWVLRLDGVHFNSQQDYNRRNLKIKESVMDADGVLYQSKWGKAMADEYCGESWGETVIMSNAVDPPQGWVKKLKKDRKVFLACSRWGDNRYQRKFKRLEDTILAFNLSGLASKGYRLVILGQHYLNETDYAYPGVEFKNRVSSKEVWEYLSTAACFVHLSWFDCCPNGVVEALAAKVPVVYCAEGVAELVGKAGVHVPDSLLNHPCDIGKPPNLHLPDISEAMKSITNGANFNTSMFPDVSMVNYGKEFATFLRRVYEKGPRRLRENIEVKKPVKPVFASTEDMR